MMPVSRSARVLLSIAVVSLVAMVLLYAFPASDRRTLVIITDICWTWAAAFATFACFASARRVTTSEQRRMWQWVGAGCTSFLAGQIVWNYYDLLRGPPPYPSVADVGFLGFYGCLIVGLLTLLRGQPARRADPELILDTVLVTFTLGALSYDYLLEPLLGSGIPVATVGLVTSIAWSIGAVAVLWMIMMQMLRRPAFPAATAALVLPAAIFFVIGGQVYAVVALRGTYRAGGPLDLTWDLGLLFIAVAAAIAPDYAQHLQRRRPTSTDSNTATRFVALVIGLAAMTGMAIDAVLHPLPEPDDALIIGIGMAIIAARVLYSLGAGSRYAHVLEDEVANQTRSLMSSLSATASAERNLRLLMEAVPDAITVVDRDGYVLDENSSGRVLVNPPPGEPRERSGRRSALAWLEGTGARIARENLAAAFDGELRRFEVPFQRPDRSDGTAQVLIAPVREGGRIPKALVLVRDITEQRRTQTQLQQAEKLAAMGQLVSGVAHEINNPAAIISGFAQTLLLDQLPPDQRETVQMMYDEATRIGRITSNLLAFARAGSKERTLVELNEIVRRTFALRSYHLSTLNITVNLELDDANPKAWANGSEVQQLLLNLLINAEQALTTVPERRAITIRTMAGDDGLELQVADTGPGIPPDIQEKIFDPFFTTKPEGMGTGLGLSICYGIVHDHGGRISVHSVPGNGATFTVSLPRDARTRQRSTPPPMLIPLEAREPDVALSVLLIDDEEGLRRAVVSFLKRRGMHVIAVEDGGDALRVLRRERFDVIVSDVRMPGMSGGEFLDRLRREHPAMVNRLIFTTGDTFADDTSSLLKDAGVPSLVKPYDFAKLEEVLRQVADAAKTAT